MRLDIQKVIDYTHTHTHFFSPHKVHSAHSS